MKLEQKEIYNELVSKYEFNILQKEQIRLGLKNNVEVSIYAKPEFNCLQMQQIRYG